MNKLIKLKSLTRKGLLKLMCSPQDTCMIGKEEYAFWIQPELLNNRRILVYSFGVGEDLSFSEGILREFDSEVYAFDPTPKSIEYVHNHPIASNPRFHFTPFGLSDRNQISTFFLPQNDEWVSGSCIIKQDKKACGIEVEMRDLDTLMKANNHTHLDILKMDIEGSEFDVVKKWHKNGDVPDIDQICVEVHDRFLSNGLQILIGFLYELRVMGYKLISVSDSGEELTFIKKNLKK